MKTEIGEAINQLSWHLGYHGDGELPVFLDGRPNPTHRLPCSNLPRTGERLARIAAYNDLQHSSEVAIGLPRIAEFVYQSTMLWSWISGSVSEKLAKTFAPAPSIVLRIGSSSVRLLLWVLRNPIVEEEARLLNERISYVLKAPRTRCKPEILRCPLPGTFARSGRQRPAPVLLTRLQVVRGLEAEQVAGGLREPPERWKPPVEGTR